MSTAASPTETETARLLRVLEAAGKRNTAQRVAICRALAAHPGHPTVAEVFTSVREEFPMMSQATVYNTLETLRELGAIIQLDIANHDHIHYDLDVRPHVNVVCRHCENIADLHIESVAALIEEAGERSGFEINHTAGLILYGVCPKCRSRFSDLGAEQRSAAEQSSEAEQSAGGRR